MASVLQELQRRGWTNKRWITRKGHPRGGRIFTRTSLYQFLTNIAYIGKVKHKHQVYVGEHTAIVDQEVWQSVQEILRRKGTPLRQAVPNRFGAFPRDCCGVLSVLVP
jgi:site-specific DNA recombinase